MGPEMKAIWRPVEGEIGFDAMVMMRLVCCSLVYYGGKLVDIDVF